MRLRTRTLFLPVVVAASVALPATTSLTTATAATITYSFSAPPIASAGSIGPSKSVTFVLRVLSDGVPEPGGVAVIAYQGGTGTGHVVGDVTAVPAAQCGGQTQLPTSGSAIQCTADSNGQLALTYTAPAQPPAQGRADWQAQGSFAGGGNRAITHYVYTTVYRFNPSPVAPGGSLGAGASVPVVLTAEDGLNHAVSGSTAYLSFMPTSGGGFARVGSTPLSTTPTLFTADVNGAFQLTYTAPSTLPSTGKDSMIVQDLVSGRTEVNTDSYAFTSSAPVLSVGDATVVEGDQIPGIPAKFTVTISPVQPNPVTLQYVTLCGIGDKGCSEDFKQVVSPITITIPANATNVTFVVRQFSYVGGNEIGETYNEGWFVELLNPGVGLVGRSIGNGMLLPDPENGFVEFPVLSVGDVGLVPTTAPAGTPEWFTVTLGVQQSSDVTFSYSTADGTAIANTDYRPLLSKIAVIPAGKTSFVIKVTLLPNSPPAGNRTFTVTISNASGGLSIYRATGTGTILAG